MDATTIFALAGPTLILCSLGLRILLRFSYGARGPDANDVFYSITNTLSWMLILLAVFPVLLVVGGSILGLIVVLLLVALIFDAILARRASLRQTSCSLLALAAGSGARIGPEVVRIGAHDRGIVGSSTRRLMLALESGMSLSEAVRRFPGALPREAPAYLAAGEVIGAETEALGQLASQENAEISSLWRMLADRTVYLSIVLLTTLILVTFMMIKIMPEYEKIFAEFGLYLPHMTMVVVRFSDLFVDYWYLFALPLFWGILLAIVFSILHLCDVRVFAPLSDRLFRPRLLGHVWRILALAAEHRHSLAPVLERLGQVFPAANVRRRLQQVHQAVADGADWRDALLRSRLIRPAEHALLGTAQQVGNLPWALRLVAVRGERRMVYRWTAAIQVVFPLLIVATGTLVGMFCIGMFVPLIKLVEGLT